MSATDRHLGETADDYAHRMIDQCRRLLGIEPDASRDDEPLIIDNRLGGNQAQKPGAQP